MTLRRVLLLACVALLLVASAASAAKPATDESPGASNEEHGKSAEAPGHAGDEPAAAAAPAPVTPSPPPSLSPLEAAPPANNGNGQGNGNGRAEASAAVAAVRGSPLQADASAPAQTPQASPGRQAEHGQAKGRDDQSIPPATSSAPADVPPAAEPTPPVASPVHDVTDVLTVRAHGRGVEVDVAVDRSDGFVQLWRQASGEETWTLVAAGAVGDALVDAEGRPGDAYKATWSSSQVSVETVQQLAPSWVKDWSPKLARVPGGAVLQDTAATWALGLLWLGAAAFGAVRLAPAGGEGLGASLRIFLDGQTGVDGAQLRRLEALGLRSAAQLLALDPDAVDFWANLPSGTALRWQGLLQARLGMPLPPLAAAPEPTVPITVAEPVAQPAPEAPAALRMPAETPRRSSFRSGEPSAFA